MPKVTTIPSSSLPIPQASPSTSIPIDTLSQPSPTSAKRMGLIFGDAFIKNDPSLEGWDPKITADYWRGFLQKAHDQKLTIPIGCSEATLSSLQGDLDDCRLSAELFQKGETQQLLQKIHAGLEKRGRFALSLGYAGKEGGSGHVFACVLERNKKGEVYAQIMNKGEGLEDHPVTGIDGDGKVKRSYRYFPIKLKNKAFFSQKEGKFDPAAERLLEYLAAYQKPPVAHEKEYSSQEMYDYFLCIGTVDRSKDILHEDVSVTPQRSGTCSEQLCRMILRYGLTKDNSSYKRMMVSFKYQALFDGLHSPEVSTKMLLLCKHSFAQTAGKAYTEGDLTKEEYAHCLWLCNEVDKKAKEHPLLDVSQALPPLDGSYTPVIVESSIYEPGLTSSEENRPIHLSIYPPQNFLTEIKKIDLLDQTTIDRDRNAVFRFIKGLPIPSTVEGKAYWDAIPKEEISDIQHHLASIIRSYNDHRIRNDNGNKWRQFLLACHASSEYLEQRLLPLELRKSNPSIPLDSPVHLSKCAPQELLEEMKEINVSNRETINRDRYVVFSWIKDLPIPSTPEGKTYWDVIPEREIADILTRLKEIVEAYAPLEDIYDKKRIRNGSMERLLFCFSCYASADYLAHRLPSLKLNGFNTSIPLDPLPPFLLLRNGQDAERYQQLKAYFDDTQKGFRLFEEMAPLDEVTLQELFNKFKADRETTHPIQKRWAYAEQFFPSKDASLKTYLQHASDYWIEDRTEHPSPSLSKEFHALFYLFQYTKGYSNPSSLDKSRKLITSLDVKEEQGRIKEHLSTSQARSFSYECDNHPVRQSDAGYFNVGFNTSDTKATTLSSSDENHILTDQEKQQFPKEIYDCLPLRPTLSGFTHSYHTYGIFGDKVSLEVRQELYKAYEDPSLRIGATLQFIERYGNAFDDVGVRSFVEICFLHQDLLVQKIESEPEILNELRRVIDQKIEECQLPHLHPQALYWIRLGYHIETHAARLNADKQIPPVILEQLDQKILALEDPKNSSTFFDSIMHRLLIRSHQENPSEQKLAEIYALRVALTCVDCSQSYNVHYLDTLKLFLAKHLDQAVYTLIKEENTASFFSFLSRYIQIPPSNDPLTCSTPPILTRNTCSFNLFSGEFYQDSERVCESVWDEKTIQMKEKFFPGITPKVRKQADGSLVGLDIPFRLRFVGNGYEFIKEMDGRWWCFSESTAGIPQQLLDPQLVPGCSQNSPLRCWISEEAPEMMLITDDHDRKIYTINQEGAVHRTFTTLSNEEEKEILCNPPEGLKDLLSTIWKEDEIFVWGEKRGEDIVPRHIEFPSLHLRFNLKQKDTSVVAECDLYHGYVLSNPQGCPELGGLKGTLTIERESDPTKRMVLIPLGKLNSDVLVEGKMPIISHEKMVDESRLLAFEIDPENGHLIPEGGDPFRSYLYLINILLRDKKYEKATYYIKRIQQERPLSNTDWVLFTDIAKGARLSPESSSLVLQLGLMALNPRVFFQSSPPIQEEPRQSFLFSLLDHFSFIQSLSGSKEILKVPDEHQLNVADKRELIRLIMKESATLKTDKGEREILTHRALLINEVINGIFTQSLNSDMKFFPSVSTWTKIKIFVHNLRKMLSIKHLFFPFPRIYKALLETRKEIKDEQDNAYKISWTDPAYKPAIRMDLNGTSAPFNLKTLLGQVKEATETVSVVDLDLVNLRHQQCETKLGHFLGFLEAARLQPHLFTPVVSKLVENSGDTFDPSLLGSAYQKAEHVFASSASERKATEKWREGRVPSTSPFKKETAQEVRRFHLIHPSTPWESPLGGLADDFFKPERVPVLEESAFNLPVRELSIPLASKKLNALRKAHDEKNAPSKTTKFFLREAANVSQLQTTLSTLSQDNKELRLSIEQLANKDMDSPSLSSTEKQMQVHFGRLHRLTMDKGILSAIIAQDASKLKALNPSLSDADCNKIYQMTIDYLIQCSRCDQAKNALEALNKGNYQECAEILSRKRHYDPYEHPLLCLYEYATGNMFRETPNQAALLLKIFAIAFEKKQTNQSRHELRRLFFEFQAGGGKTKVISAIIAAKAHHDGKLPVFFSLPEIFDIVKGDLRSTLSQVFEKKVDVIDLRLHSHPTKEQLRALLKQTQTALKEGRCQVMTPESYHSLFLELQTGLKEKDKEKVRITKQLLDFYKEHAVFLIDESHRNVDSLLQANVARGKPQLIPADERQLYLACYDILTGQKEISLEDGRKIHEVLELRQNRQALTSKKDLDAILRTLATNLVKEYKLKTNIEPLLNKELSTQAWKKLHKDQRRLLCLIRGLCTEVLPHCLMQVEGMDHGPSIHANDPLDAPRRFKNPSTSKFESPDIAAALSIHGYYQRGLQNPFEWKNLLLDLHEKFQAELVEYQKLEQCPTYKKFLSWQTKKPLLSIELFDKERISDDTLIAKVMQSIDPKNPQVIRTYLKRYVLPRVIIFPYKMTSTAQDLVRGCLSSILFSATLGPKGQNPLVERDEHYLEDVAFQADVMHRSCMPHNSEMHWMDESTPRALLDNLWNKTPQAFSTLDGMINLGGWSKYSSNLDWAKEWLQFSADKELNFEGVLFKQEVPTTDGSLGEKVYYLLMKGHDEPIRLATGDIQKELRLRGYGEKRIAKIYGPDDTTGTDLQLTSNAKMILTVGEGTMASPLVQAIMRERQFLKSPIVPEHAQSLLWVMPTALKPKMEEVVGPVNSPQECWLWAIHQEAKREEASIIACALQEIDGVLRNHALTKIEQGQGTFETYQGLFEKELGRDVEALYGTTSTKIGSRKFLEEYVKRQTAIYRIKLLSTEKELVESSIKQASQAVPQMLSPVHDDLSNAAQQEQVQVKESIAEAKAETLGKAPSVKEELPYATSTLTLSSPPFWDAPIPTLNQRLKTSIFPSSLTFMDNAWRIDTGNSFLKPIDRLLLVGRKQGTEWVYEYRAISQQDANAYQKQILEGKVQKNTRIALVLATGVMDQNGKKEQGIPLQEWRTLQKSDPFNTVIASLEFFNGKPEQVERLKSMIQQNPAEWTKIKLAIQSQTFDPNRLAIRQLDNLFPKTKGPVKETFSIKENTPPIPQKRTSFLRRLLGLS